MTLLPALALWLALAQAGTQPASDFRAVFERGVAALAAQQFDAAEQAFLEARSLNPRHAFVHFHLAQIHQARQQFEPAIAQFRQAIALEPGEPQFYFRLALLQAQLQRFHDARQVLEELLRVRPGLPGAYLLLGRVAQEEGDHEQAERHLRRYLRLRPDDADGLWRLGVTLVARDNYKEAESLLQSALRKDAKLGPAHYNLGVLYSRRGEEAKARPHLESATRLMPDNAQTFYQLGVVLQRVEDSVGAEAALRQALALAPRDAASLYALGNLLRRSGREEEAASHMAEYERLSAALLEDRERTKRLGSFHLEVKELLEQDRVIEAEVKLAEILALDPVNDLATYREGQIAFLRQDYVPALEKARRAIRRKGFEPGYHLLEAMCLERLGQDEQAAQAYERVLRLAEYADAHVALAGIAGRRGNLAQAVEHMKSAVALEPRNPDLRTALAEVLAQAGDLAGSRRERARARALRNASTPR